MLEKTAGIYVQNQLLGPPEMRTLIAQLSKSFSALLQADNQLIIYEFQQFVWLDKSKLGFQKKSNCLRYSL